MKTNKNISLKIADIAAEFNDNGVKVRSLKELVTFGNTKLGRSEDGYDIAIFSLESSLDCSSDKKGYCHLSKECYAKALERRYKNITPFINSQQLYWKTHTVEEFYNDFIIMLRKTKKKVKYFRFNVYGDISSLEDLYKIWELSELLKADNILIYMYTKGKDIIEQAKLSSWFNDRDNLVISGSGYMIDNNFRDLKVFTNNPNNLQCLADCSVCTNCMVKGNKIIEVLLH